jgi:uncharacterized paraquat-inducible protein A
LRAFFTIVAILAAIQGFRTLAFAKSAVHEIEAGIGFLICVVAAGFAALIGSVESVAVKLSEQRLAFPGQGTEAIGGGTYQALPKRPCKKCRALNNAGNTVCTSCGSRLQLMRWSGLAPPAARGRRSSSR